MCAGGLEVKVVHLHRGETSDADSRTATGIARPQ